MYTKNRERVRNRDRVRFLRKQIGWFLVIVSPSRFEPPGTRNEVNWKRTNERMNERMNESAVMNEKEGSRQFSYANQHSATFSYLLQGFVISFSLFTFSPLAVIFIQFLYILLNRYNFCLYYCCIYRYFIISILLKVINSF